MRIAWRWLAVLFVGGLVALPVTIGQTPDEETPAEEEACKKYEGEGARYGLCIAYCEAQDCEGLKLDPISCRNIEQNFIDWSKKKDYAVGPKDQPIDCRIVICSKEDQAFCGGREIDCLDNTGDCEPVCSSEFLGRDDRGNPICTKIEACKKCVADTPKS